MSIVSFLESAARSFGDYALRATLLLLLANACVWVFQRSSAATRHLIWTVTFAGLLALPFLDFLAPLASPVGAIARLLPPHPASGVSDISTLSGPADLRWNLLEALSGASSLSPRSATPGLAVTLVTFWAVGGLSLVARRLAILAQASRQIHRRALVVPGPRVSELFLECVHEAHLDVRVRLRCSDEVMMTPATLGWRRPTVLLGAASESWSDDRLRAVFRHELAHIRRTDWLVQQVAWIGYSLLWFHPLAWFGYRALCLEAERAADDAVLRCGVRPSTYSTELLALLQFIQTPEHHKLKVSSPMKASIPMAQPSTMEVRIRAILDRTQNRRGLNAKQIAALMPVALCAMIPLSLVHLQAADPKAAAPGETVQLLLNAGKAIVLDRSTPEAAVKSFADAINAGDFANAAACVKGGDPARVMERKFTALLQQGQPHIQLGEVLSKINGESALVIVASGAVSMLETKPGAEPVREEHPLKDEHVSLVRDGTSWVLVPGQFEEGEAGKIGGVLQGAAAILAAPEESLAKARNAAEMQVNMSQMRQLAVAAFQYAAGHNDKFSFRADGVREALLPYLATTVILTPPGGKTEYVFNSKLENVSLVSIGKPSETVLFYEVAAGTAAPAGGIRPPVYKDNQRTGVAFADGHVAALSPEEFSKVLW